MLKIVVRLLTNLPYVIRHFRKTRKFSLYSSSETSPTQTVPALHFYIFWISWLSVPNRYFCFPLPLYSLSLTNSFTLFILCCFTDIPRLPHTPISILSLPHLPFSLGLLSDTSSPDRAPRAAKRPLVKPCCHVHTHTIHIDMTDLDSKNVKRGNCSAYNVLSIFR